MPRPSSAAPFTAILERRFSRRGLLQAGGSVAAAAAISTLSIPRARSSSGPPSFVPVTPQSTDAVVLSEGYVHDLLIRWGDSLFTGTPDLTPQQIQQGYPRTAEGARDQERQFGINCDGLAFLPRSAGKSNAGILCINNEYTQAELMFAGRRGIGRESAEERRRWILDNPHAVAAMKAAQGVSVVEVFRRRGRWQFRRSAPLNRRITAETPMLITGPARGSAYLRTKADPDGVLARGTMANCACGTTPWGTYLTCEENIDDYFGFARSWAASGAEREILEAYRRFGLRERSYYGWEHIDPRFDVRAEPREALRFGWVVEIDPWQPQQPPRKRTALGRFQHEAAKTLLARDNRVAAYMGDDEPFEYVYKFVTRDRFDPRNPQANRDLLDAGTLYVARFDADGTGEWLPLVYDEKGPLNRRAGFTSQADVIVRTRAAADVLGATPMDRPEGIQPIPAGGRIYIACTNNVLRTPQGGSRELNGRTLDVGTNAANPRAPNRTGHIIELIENDGDAAATRFSWNVFLLAGHPQAPGSALLTRYEDVAAARPQDTYYAGVSRSASLSPFACPDNLGLDPFGRLWIVTDGHDALRANDGCYVCPTTGPERGVLRQLMSAPVGAEVCGCDFTPDGTTVFLSIQHPGAGGSVDAPISHWPDGGAFPARPAVIAVRREDGDPL